MKSNTNMVLTDEQLLQMGKLAKGEINTIYLHWTAGPYGHVYDDYHLCIGKDGEFDAPVGMMDLTMTLAHTWMRNSHSVGIAVEAARGAKIDRDGAINFGKYSPPTQAQIEGMARAVALICCGAELSITKDTVMTHAEIADMDGYGVNDNDPDMRWDLLRLPNVVNMSGGDYIRRLANNYLTKIKKGGEKSGIE